VRKESRSYILHSGGALFCIIWGGARACFFQFSENRNCKKTLSGDEEENCGMSMYSSDGVEEGECGRSEWGGVLFPFVIQKKSGANWW